MHKLRLVAAFALVALTLGGCAQVRETWQKIEGAISAVTGATIDPKALIIAASAWDALEVTAKNYVDPRINRRCTGTNGPICRDPEVTKYVNAAVEAGIAARNDVQAFLRDHPGELGTQGLYEGLQLAIANLKRVFALYNIKAGP
jgi:hypothetical protein